ncbi:MAG: DUF4870 domain-containing protein [Actinomycetota bacterium]
MSETPPPPPAAPQPAAPLSESDERLYATLANGGNIIFPLIAPLIVWLIFRERSTFVDTESKEALNFGILAVIVYLVASFTFIIVIGFLLWPAMFIVAVIFGIQAVIKNNKGEHYRYPFSLRLIK